MDLPSSAEKFDTAARWRGEPPISLILYGLWEGAGHRPEMDQVLQELRAEQRAVEVSLHVATDEEEGWPCSVGVFDIGLQSWPLALEDVFRRWLGVISRHEAHAAWMMFEGTFMAVGDIFSELWGPSIYAIRAADTDESFVAINDDERASRRWVEIIAMHRRRVLARYPMLDLLTDRR